MHYVPLNIKTNYQLLGSLIRIDELISYALKNNIEALGITDSNMFSCIEFYNACIKNNIKPIIGIDLEINEEELILYAKNFDGYKNLCKIVTEKSLGNLNYEYLKKYKEDIICICPYENVNNYKNLISIYKDTYISYESKAEKKNALIISKNVVYSKEILYFNESDSEYLKYLYMIRDGKTIDNKFVYNCEFNNFDLDIDALEMETTYEFSKLIDLEFPKFNFNLPKYSDKDSTLLLRSLCKKGIFKRLNGEVSKIYSDRLLYELSIIEKMGFVDYFLIVYDFILYAKKNKIYVGPGRGSAAGSLVSYVLGITDINPIEFNLIFERFLNPERISMPDIDVDLSDIKRNKVVEYVKNKYGKENVANIITFGTLLPKQVIRDVGRTLNLSVEELDKICKSIKFKETFKEIEKDKTLMDIIKSDKRYLKLFDISKKLENLKRHTSIHAAGVVISAESLTNIMPLYNSGDNILTAYSMNFLEELGLLKIDFLGLSNLTIIDNVVSLIKQNEEVDINLNNLPLDDKKTIELFNKVDTVGIFQFESGGMKSFLKEFKINDFNDIVAAIALYRPGPKEMIPTYIRRKEGKEKVSYIIKDLEPILKDTYGIIIYQEQILEILKVIGGYSYAEADKVRRAMSKKKEDIILKEKEIFIKNTINNGYDKKNAIELFNLILKFADYGFNKSHSVAYSLIGYQMAYLKSNYKEYFMMNLLNMVIGREEKTKEYIDESRILGLKFQNININLSESEYILNEDKKLIFPFTIVKNIGSNTSKEIVDERKKGLFKDFYDFMARTYGQSVNRKVVENLIEVGAFNIFNVNKKAMINNIDKIIDYALLCKDLDKSLVLIPEIEEIEDFNDSEILEREYNSLGFYISNHPVINYKRENMCTLKEIEKYFDKNVSSIVLIENIKSILTKNKEKMAFITASDEYRKIECVLFPRVYSRFMDIKKGNIVKLNGKIEKRLNVYQIIVNDLEILK